MNYYCYAYLRSDSDSYGPAGSPYYIGKGTEGTNRETNKHLQRLGSSGSGIRDIVPENEDQIVILKNNLTEKEAYELESELIKFYGRVDRKTGCLWNMNDGGTGGQSNYVYPDYLKEMRREALKGNNYGSRVDWSDPDIKRRHREGMENGKPFVKTAKGYEADEYLKIPYDWEHPINGIKKSVCCMDMERETGYDQSGFWLVANGKSGSTHGWTCLNPKKKWEPKEFDAKAAARAAADSRTAKNAAQLGLSVEEYQAMDYSSRSRLRKKLGIKSELEIDAEKAGMSLAEWKNLSTWERKKLRDKFKNDS